MFSAPSIGPAKKLIAFSPSGKSGWVPSTRSRLGCPTVQCNRTS